DTSFPPPMSDRCTMRATKAALLLLAFLSASPPVRLTAQDYRAQALRILKTVPLIDGHNDIPDAIRERGGLDSVDFAVLQPKLMTDIPKLRAGGVGAQFWAAYVPVTTIDSGPHPAVDRRRSLPRQRRNDVGRAPHDARSRHVFALLGPRAHRPRAGRAGFDPQARAEERRDRHGEFQPRLRLRGGAPVRRQHGSPD